MTRDVAKNCRDHTKPSICLVAHFAHGVLSGERTGHVGGVEKQTTLMARWLASHGYRVSMVTWDEGQPDEQEIDGIRVIKLCRQNAGVPVIRFFHPRWSSLARALRRAHADVYYHNCGEYVTGQVALWCRMHRKPFVYSVASDPDCDVRLPKMPKRYERELYRYGLVRADRLIVQTRKQEQMIRQGFHRESLVIPMPCVNPPEGVFVAPDPPTRDARILWVGRIASVKQLEWFLDIAEACPDLAFDVVGPTDGTEYAAGLLRRAGRIPNVSVHGKVDSANMRCLYRSAALLCCTSRWEGFPNTFLEAWSHGVPVVSTVDPDERITEVGMGAIGIDVDGLIAGIRHSIGSSERWSEMSRNARRYYMANHTLEAVMPRFERVFLDVTEEATRAGATDSKADLQHA